MFSCFLLRERIFELLLSLSNSNHTLVQLFDRFFIIYCRLWLGFEIGASEIDLIFIAIPVFFLQLRTIGSPDVGVVIEAQIKGHVVWNYLGKVIAIIGQIEIRNRFLKGRFAVDARLGSSGCSSIFLAVIPWVILVASIVGRNLFFIELIHEEGIHLLSIFRFGFELTRGIE